MNNFLTVLCIALIASASAKPGYNYQQPSKVQSSSGFKQVKQFSAQTLEVPTQATISVSASSPATIGLPAPAQYVQQYVAPATQYTYNAPVQQQQQQQQFVVPVQQQQQQQFVVPVQQQQQQYVAPVQQQYLTPTYHTQVQPQQTIVTKEIFIHAGPEEVEEIGSEIEQPAVPNRKNYRIVFVKAPSQNIKFNVEALKRTQAVNEEKTVIYVLSKKPDLTTIQNQLTVVQNQQKTHKPEVHFIKYKTQEEANRAQQQIQAQYESLGGSTSITDEGIAPVTSVIGTVGNNRGNFVSGTGGNSFVQQQTYQTSQNTAGGIRSYLPPTKK